MCAVEWKKLGDVVNLSRGVVISKDYLRDNEGIYPVYSSQTANDGVLGRISTYNYDGEFLTWTTDGANAGTVFHRFGKFSITNVCGLIKIKDEAIISYRYLYYWLNLVAKNYVSEGMGNPKLMSNAMGNIVIPLIPIAKQQEIVSHLDTFTTLISNLESELYMRRKQYEHYRNQLLDFEGVEGVEWKTLGEVAPYRKSRIEYSLLNTHNYVSVENLLQMKKGKTDAEKVPSEGNAIKYETGDILVGNIRPYLKKIWMAEYVGGTNGDVLVFGIKDKSILISKYLFYLLSSDAFFEYDNQHAKGGKMPRGDKSMIEKYLIPIPSPKAQQEIVSKLDAFENLIQSLEQEIKLRKGQYEYYREKLLTFD